MRELRANLASALEYPWTSYGCYIGHSCPVSWVCTQKTLNYINGPEAYRAFVESPIDAIDPWNSARAGIVYGGKDFVERIKLQLQNTSHKQSSAVLQALSRADQRLRAAEVRVATEKVFANSSACQRGMMVAYALHSFALTNIEEIAGMVKRTPSAISHSIRAISARLKDDPTLAAKMSALARACGLSATL